ncbi:DNA primase catalytic subunit PriS [Halobacteriales archaeon QS_9_67_15]|nr:MAG: DNA primase catalytic subunit PriS [Halobacteriales archaeon QS_9_67_15]
MQEQTRAYLRGRFGDHYRRTEFSPPPAANEREWGYVPWTDSPGETMVRHRSLLDMGSLAGFLSRERPKHVYFSAGRYESPAVSSMSEKRWRSSDLVFDLDADHLPSVTPGDDSYAEMLAKCKDALRRLLDFLEADFGFEDLTVVFSGSRGYHVHVRDGTVQQLESDARREVVDYVRGIGLNPELVETTEMRGGVTRRALETEGGWGRRVHGHLLDYVDDLVAMAEDEAKVRLQELDGVGEKRASTVYGALENNAEALEAGNIELGGVGLRTLLDGFVSEVVERQNAPIDEPVSTDVNRLIRLPGSLHGGSALEVRRIDPPDLDDFDPLVDAVPETFVGHEISIDVTGSGPVELYGDSFNLEAGESSVPEYLGAFLMARGRAEKAPE